MKHAEEKRSFPSVVIIGAGFLLHSEMLHGKIIMTDDPCVLCTKEEPPPSKKVEEIVLIKTQETLSLIFTIKETVDYFLETPNISQGNNCTSHFQKIPNKKILQSVPSISRGPPKGPLFYFLLLF